MLKLHSKLSEMRPLKKILKNHEDYYASVSKLGKNIDKTFSY